MPSGMAVPRRTAIVWLLLVLAAVAWTGLVARTLAGQEEVARRGAERSQAAQSVLTSLLDQDTAARAYVAAGADVGALPQLREGRATLRRELGRLRAMTPDRGGLRPSITAQQRIADRWEAATDRRLSRVARTPGVRSGRRPPPRDLAGSRERIALVRTFREESARFQRELSTLRAEEAADGTRRALVLVVLMGLALAGGALALVLRGSRAEVRREEARSDFAEALSTADDEPEAHRLLVRHVGRSIPGASAQVLAHDAETDLLRAATELPTDSPLREALRGATSRSCLAVRQARVHEQGGRADPLQRCDLCGRAPGLTTCAPLVVQGRVIGSVLAEHQRPLSDGQRRTLLGGVGQAAPVLGNLRTLARAEARAATDSLTGLPNRRVVEETLGRLHAQATRSITPLSVIMLDLDRFKALNDHEGHAAGDAALAAVGRLLRTIPRAGDVAGRWGGEEFVVVLPDTDAAGAAAAAENLRASIAELSGDGTTPPMTASMGVASYPEHDDDLDALLELADRALYAAKRGGRDRVELARAVEA